MWYYNICMKNVVADTKMRESIASDDSEATMGEIR